jgi:hypothetical protein
MRGFIYILKHGNNQQFKVGKTTKPNPLDRLKELDSTGVPEKLEMIACFPVKDPDTAEKIAHKKLERYHSRREYFSNITDEEIIKIVKESVNTPFEDEIPENFHHKDDEEIFKALINENSITFEKLCMLADSNEWSARIWLGFREYYFKKLFYIFTYKKIFPSNLLNRNLKTLREDDEELDRFHRDFIAKLADLNIKNYINNTSNIFSKKTSSPENILFLGAALFILANVSEGKKSVLFSNWKNQIESFSYRKATLNDRGLHYHSLHPLYEFVSKCRNYKI